MTSFEGKAIAPVQDELIEGDDDYSSEDDADEDIYMDILDCMYVCTYVRITIYGARISLILALSLMFLCYLGSLFFSAIRRVRVRAEFRLCITINETRKQVSWLYYTVLY